MAGPRRAAKPSTSTRGRKHCTGTRQRGRYRPFIARVEVSERRCAGWCGELMTQRGNENRAVTRRRRTIRRGEQPQREYRRQQRRQIQAVLEGFGEPAIR